MRLNQYSMKHILITLCIYLLTVSAFCQKWTFALVADNCGWHTGVRYMLTEIRDMTINETVPFPKAEFIVAAGDLDLANENWGIVQDPQYQAPPYYPVMGNHDDETPADVDLMLDTILPSLDSVVLRDNRCNYYVDWKNVRIIVFDQYSGLGQATWINWMDSLITDADFADHVFISFHGPAFPRGRYAGPPAAWADDLWNMLLSHGTKVKGIMVGHTHSFCRMRVLDPHSACAFDGLCYPDEPGGIYQIDAGALGITGGDNNNTIVYVEVDGANLRFMTVACPFNNDSWAMTDYWILGPDSLAPYVTDSKPSGTVNTTEVIVLVETQENAFVRWSMSDQSYYEMANQFVTGEGAKIHTTTLSLENDMAYTFYVRAVDDSGNVMDTSRVITFTIDTLCYTVTWKDQGYDDGSWSTGTAEIGYGDGDENTVIPHVDAAYFRKSFFIDDASAFSSCSLGVKYDDGVVVYLNGYEIARRSMLPGEVTYSTFASGDHEGSAFAVNDITSFISHFRNGGNVIAAEVHQVSSTSSDLSFDLELYSGNDTLVAPQEVWFYSADYNTPEDKSSCGGTTGAGISASTQNDMAVTVEPNPFNPVMVISIFIGAGLSPDPTNGLPAATSPTLRIYNVQGVCVHNAGTSFLYNKRTVNTACTHAYTWNARNMPSGTYIIRICVNGIVYTKRAVLLR